MLPMTSVGARAAAPPAPSRPKGGRPQGAGSGGARGHSVRAADRHPVAWVDGRAGHLRQDLVVPVATACGVSRPSWPPSTIICNFAMRPVRSGPSILLAWLDQASLATFRVLSSSGTASPPRSSVTQAASASRPSPAAGRWSRPSAAYSATNTSTERERHVPWRPRSASSTRSPAPSAVQSIVAGEVQSPPSATQGPVPDHRRWSADVAAA